MTYTIPVPCSTDWAMKCRQKQVNIVSTLQGSKNPPAQQLGLAFMMWHQAKKKTSFSARRASRTLFFSISSFFIHDLDTVLFLPASLENYSLFVLNLLHFINNYFLVYAVSSVWARVSRIWAATPLVGHGWWGGRNVFKLCFLLRAMSTVDPTYVSLRKSV